MKRKFTFLIAAAFMLLTMMASTATALGQTRTATDVLTLDCATPAPTGSTSTALSSTSDVATFLNAAAGLSSATNKITCSDKTGDVYKGKGSGGGNIPQQCLKIGKASGPGSITFTIPEDYDNIDVVEITCYGWKTSSSISINSGTAQTFSTAQVEVTKTFELASSTRTITIAVTSSAVCITEIVLKKNDASSVATPTFSHTTDTYYGPQNVTISCATSGAEIHYTMGNNPADPTASSALYNGPIAVTETTTIKAIAIKSGMSNSSVASTTLTIQPTVFNQDWEGAMNGWTFVNITGAQVWSVASYSGNHHAKMSGYDSGNNANEDWCISPAFNLGDYTNPYLTFTTARSNHDGNELEVYFSNNYDGTNVSSATWTQLTCTLPAQPSSGYTNFTSSGNIDLSSYSGNNCYIGFKYTSTTSAAVTWELDDIVLASQTTTPTITLTPSSIDAGSNNPTGAQISKTFTVSQSNLTAGITLSTTLGTLSTASVAQGASDAEITWTYTPNTTGNFSATITATSTGADPQTLTISGSAVDPIVGDCYELVTSAPQDWSGAYIITGTNSGNYYALTGVSSNLGTTAAVSVVGDKIESTATTDSYQVIVEATTNGYSLYMDGVGYLGYNSDAASSNNYLHALGLFEANTCEWTITISNNEVTLTNVRNTGRKLQFNYNDGNSRFACYTSNQVKPNLFKYTGTIVIPPVINASNPATLAYNATSGTIAYTISNPVTGIDLNATLQEGIDWISNVNVGTSLVTFDVTENTGTADRTATITLSYEGAENKVITVTQGHYVVDYATLPFEFDGGRADIASTNGLTQENLGSDYGSSPKLKFEKGNKENDGLYSTLILKINEVPGTLTYKIKGNSFSGSTFKVQVSENGTNYTDVKTYTELGDTQTETINNLNANVRYIKWIYAEKVDGNVALGDIHLNAYDYTPSITINPPALLEVPACGDGGELQVTCANLGDSPVLNLVFCDSEGNETTYGWLTGYIKANGNVVGNIDTNTGAQRTGYLKVCCTSPAVCSNIVSITQVAYEAPTIATLPFSFNGGKEAIATTTGIVESGLGSDFGTDPKLKFKITNSYVIVHFDEEPGTLSFDIKGDGSTWTGTFKLQTSADNVTYEDLHAYTNLTETVQNEEFDLNDNVRYVRWIYTEKVGDNRVALGNISVTAAGGTTSGWVLTELDDLTDSDVFVIVGTYTANGSSYAMSNNNGTSTAPDAVAVTVVGDALSAEPADNLKWNIGENDTHDGYIFYPNNSTTTWLYSNSGSNNNRVRVGNGDNKSFVINSNYLKCGDYYVGIYSSQDWRGYTSINDNIKNQTFAFYKKQADPTAALITVNPSTVNAQFTETEGALTVTYQNVETSVGVEIIWYSDENATNALSDSPDWIAAGFDTDLNIEYLIDANNGAARTAYFKVYGVDADANDVYSNLVTISQAAYVADYATLPFAFDGGRTDIETTMGLTQEGLDSDYGSSPKLKFNTTGDWMILKLNEAPKSLSYDIKGNAFADGTFDVELSSDGINYTNLASYTELGDTQTVTLIVDNENARYVRWIYTNKATGNVALGNIHATEHYDTYGNVTFSDLDLTTSSQSLIIHDGSVVTVTGTLTNNSPDKLLIHDGGQLYHSNSVAASMEKTIEGVTNWHNENDHGGGWYLLSSPIGMQSAYGLETVVNLAPEAVAGVPQFDLFTYNEPNVQWMNFNHNSYAVYKGQGFLYARHEGATLKFSGTLPVDNTELSPSSNPKLEYTEANGDMAGWNLIGNPYSHNITWNNFTSTGDINTSGYYRMVDGAWITEASKTAEIKPMEGFLVKATGDNPYIMIKNTPSSKDNTDNDFVEFIVNSANHYDVTYALFSEGEGLEKISHRNVDIPMVYIPKDGERYAIATIGDNTEAFNLNFKAMTTGQYTLKMKANSEYSYLHVIDRLTGEDVDMLLNGEYTFIGSPRDDENRFIVRLNANSNFGADNDIFAYQNGSEIIVSGEGELQIFDVMGRFVMSRTINGNESINTATFNTGVYVLRIVGETVKTQKIVVK